MSLQKLNNQGNKTEISSYPEILSNLQFITLISYEGFLYAETNIFFYKSRYFLKIGETQFTNVKNKHERK